MPALPLAIGRPRRALVCLGLALGVSALLAPAAVEAATSARIGETTVVRISAPPDPPLLQRERYDYAPSVLFDAEEGLYRMWWCGGLAGDHILYAESSSLSGPFHSRRSTRPNTYDVALAPVRSPRNAFDASHTCDPSVMKIGRDWYLYYGGANDREAGSPTRIGLATSRDGVTWRRANNGLPIVSPVRDVRTVANGYGAGQPSITHVDGMFHLVYTDTTGYGGNQGNGAGQYVLRSRDPLFREGVEELGPRGFAPSTARRHTRHSLLEAFSTDWQFSPALDAFVLAESFTSPGGTRVVKAHFLNHALTAELPGSPTIVRATWREGTALVGGLDRRLPDPVGGVQELQVVRPLGDGSPFTWRLYPVVAQTPVRLPS